MLRIRRALPVFLTIFWLGALPSETMPAEASAEPSDAREVVLAYFELWNGDDLDTASNLLTPDFHRHSRKGESPESAAQLVQLITTLRSNFRGMRVQVELVICEAERCAMTGRFQAGITGSAKGFDMLMSSFLRLQDGRIAEEWVRANNLPSLVGIGYQTAPPGARIRRPDGSFRPEPAKEPEKKREEAAEARRALQATDPSLASPPYQMIHEYIGIWNTRQVAELEDLVAAEISRSDFHRRVTGREELARFIQEIHSIYRGFQLEILDVINQDDFAAARLRMGGELVGSGKWVEVPIIAFYWFDQEGRIVREFPLGDYVGYLEDLGYRITLPGEEIVPPPVPSALMPLGARSLVGESSLTSAMRELQDAAGRSAATLRIHTPVGCTLEIDRRILGFLPPGESVRLTLPKGERHIRALSLKGTPFFNITLRLKARSSSELEIRPPSRMIVDPRRRVAEDLQTGLLWPIQDEGSDLNWQEANAYCRSSQHGGFTDWRLPHIRELLSLHEPDSPSRWKTPRGITLSSCCPWSATQHDAWRAWNLVSYKGAPGLQPLPFRRYQRALCVHDLSDGNSVP